MVRFPLIFFLESPGFKSRLICYSYQSDHEDYTCRNLLDDKSDDTHAYEDDAHKVVLGTWSFFLKICFYCDVTFFSDDDAHKLILCT